MDRDARRVSGRKRIFTISVGDLKKDGEALIVERFSVDEAILSLSRSFKAEDYPFVKVSLTGLTRHSKFKILWRNETDQSKYHALEFNRSGDGVTQIAMAKAADAYRGTITDIALLFYDSPAVGFSNNNDSDISILSVELLPFSSLRVLEQIISDWINPPLWKGSSNNLVKGIHPNGLIFPNAVSNLLLILGLLVAVLARVCHRRQRHQSLLPTAIVLCILTMGLNDSLRWFWRIEQFTDTHERYASFSLQERVQNSDIRCARFPADCNNGRMRHF